MKKTLSVMLISGVMIVLVAAAVGRGPEEPWIHHSAFADFSAGTVGDGGSNLYVTASGTVEMIHRWDYNNDGYLDILVGQDHNYVENEDILIYWGTKTGPRSILPDIPAQQPLGRLLREIRKRDSGVTRLPSDGGGRSLLVDLNGDGYLEIVFCNYIHNYSVHMNALIYWGSAQGYRPDRRTELPTLLAEGVAAADFNRDGYVDLAFANRGIEGGDRFGYHAHLESYIYWNGPMGFSAERRTSVPSISATDCAAGDLNDDGYPELMFLNNNAQEKSVYLYWGSAEGFSEKRREEWRGGDPVGARLVDLNKDGKVDLIITHRDNRAEIMLGTGKDLNRQPWTELPTLGAVECRVGDLNRDGYVDLVFANRGAGTKQVSYIYWGSANGYAAARHTELPTLSATDSALADFNGDGWVDIGFANERDQKTYDVNSYIYWNGPQGFDAAHRSELQGFGTVSAQAADLDRDGNPDLVLISRNSGASALIDSFLYWGNPQHFYSPASMSLLPLPRGEHLGDQGMPATADLNQDGYVDVIFAAARILWGSAQGYSAERVQDFPVKGGYGASVADLNRDGYLDLVVAPGGAASKARIFWGSKRGYSPERQTELALSTQASLSSTIADLNKDGFLDLLFSDVDTDKTDIFWGDSSGTFSSQRHALLKAEPADTVKAADLNGDGWLDLIFGGGWDGTQFGIPTRQAMIMWGGPKGYSQSRALRLEAYVALEQAVADLNKDGYLDIVMTNYHAGATRTLPVFIYWGGPDGSYSESRRTSLPGESTSSVQILDLNQDGWLDLIVSNHLDRGDHGAGTNIFWGGPEGYSYGRRRWVPSFGSHFSVRQDVGNIYTRKLEEEYVSAPLPVPAGKVPSRLSWKASTPHGTAVKFQVRSTASKEGLTAAPWQGPPGTNGFFEKPEAALKVPTDHRWLQYRAVFSTPDGGSTPVLEEVIIEAKKK